VTRREGAEKLMAEHELLVERRGRIATVTFNRPDQRNALSQGILDRLRRAFAELPADPELRVIVLRGAGGKAFSAGSDFADLRRAQDRGIMPSGPDDPFEHALAAVTDCPLPVIALIEGFAVGGGCALAAACDVRIAGQSARLGMPPARLGILYSQHELAPFLDLLGPGRTKLLFFSARLFDAPAALRFGLLDEVKPDDEVEAYAYALAEEIAANAPLTIRNTKRIIRHLTRRPLDADKLAEIEALLRQTQASEDFQEGQRAVLERRQPEFRGR
jgi:enoyl-CoA hydratase/carnithine racemase